MLKTRPPLTSITSLIGKRGCTYLSHVLTQMGETNLAPVIRDCYLYEKSIGANTPHPPSVIAMERRWFDSIAAGTPDYGIYDFISYLPEAWVSWAIYSRSYIRTITKELPGKLPRPRSIVDLGCGIGFSTSALKQAYPTAAVHGTNIEGSRQYDLNCHMASTYGFTMHPCAEAVPGPVDWVFASEYFEHWEAPIEHLETVVAALEPKVLILANAFNTRANGHFPVFHHRGHSITNDKMTKAFHTALGQRGYKRLPIKAWNGRPAVWARSLL
jgi:SAM-dependent methyltransferase